MRTEPVVLISYEHQAYRWATRATAMEMPLVWHVKRTLSGLG